MATLPITTENFTVPTLLNQQPDSLRDLLGKIISADEVDFVLHVLKFAADLMTDDKTGNYAKLEAAVKLAYQAVCPPPCQGIDPAWYQTEDGMLLAEAEFYLYQDELITISEAAKLLYGGTEKKHLMVINRLTQSGKLRVYNRPESDYRFHRAEVKNPNIKPRSRLVNRSDVENIRLSKGKDPVVVTILDALQMLGDGWHSRIEIANAIGSKKNEKSDIYRLLTRLVYHEGILEEQSAPTDQPNIFDLQYRLKQLPSKGV